jgi:hypothetical protein
MHSTLHLVPPRTTCSCVPLFRVLNAFFGKLANGPDLGPL